MELNIVCIGNSITHGAYIDGNADPIDTSGIYPVQLGDLRPNDTIFEEGKNSQTSAYLLTNFEAFVNTHYDAEKRNICIFWETSNQLGQDSDGTATPLSDEKTRVQTFVSTAQSAGWEVIVGTVIQRGQTPTATLANWRTDVTDFNTWLRANWSSFADGFADFNSLDTIFSTEFSGNGDVTYYIDTAHLNASGYALIAEEANEELEFVIGNKMRTTISGTTTRVYSAYSGKIFSLDGLNYYRGVDGGDAVSVPAVGLTSY